MLAVFVGVLAVTRAVVPAAAAAGNEDRGVVGGSGPELTAAEAGRRVEGRREAAEQLAQIVLRGAAEEAVERAVRVDGDELAVGVVVAL